MWESGGLSVTGHTRLDNEGHGHSGRGLWPR